MNNEIKLTRKEILNALNVDEKDITMDLDKCMSLNMFLEHEELNEVEQREFVKWYVSGNSVEFLKQISILKEFHLLIKRNEIVDKIQELSVKDIGNFAEKLVLEIAEDTNGNVELLDKIHEILNK